VLVDRVPADDANALVRRATFGLGAAVTQFKIKIVTTAASVNAQCHVAERVDVDYVA
jgi:hypothetical protein